MTDERPRDEAEPPHHGCPWCGSADTSRISDAGSLLMTEQWFCDRCSSAFEVIKKRGSDEPDPPAPSGPIITTGRGHLDGSPDDRPGQQR